MENPLTHKYVQPIKLESLYWLALIEHTIEKIQFQNSSEKPQFNSKHVEFVAKQHPFHKYLFIY